MNKQSFLQALDLKNQNINTPIWELEFHLWDKFGKGKFMIGADFEKLSSAKKVYALNENVETMCKVAELLSFSAITVPGGYWEVSPGIPAYYYLPDKYRFMQIELLKKDLGENVALVANAGGVMAMPEGHGYVDFSIKLMTEPEKIDVIAKNAFEESKGRIDRFAQLEVDVILTASDIADGHGLYFSPDQLERYIYPYLGEWNSYVKSRGMRSIMHSDGNINDALGSIANSGINGLQALDSTANMDIVAVQKQFEKQLCVCGNIDCGLMLTATPEKVAEATTQLLNDMKGAPNFVIGASNALQYATPIENYIAMVEAVKKIR